MDRGGEGGSEGPRVLVADDDPAIRRLMEEVLGGAGYSVTVESTGYGALQRVRERPFGIVFLDIRMPVGGAAVVKELLDLRAGAEIVIVTGNPDSEDARLALDYGARLCLSKPVNAAQVLEVAARLLSQEPPGEAAPVRGPERVLIADDDPRVRAFLLAALAEEGYECEEAVDGAEALERLKSGSFSLLLSDIQMPRMAGVELLRALRAVSPDGESDLAVVMMTGAAEVDSAVAALRLGASDYLRKPVDLPTLQLVLRRALEHRRLRIENREYRRGLEALVDRRTSELLTTYEQTLNALGSALDTRDPETRDHALRVASYTCAIAAEMGIHGVALRDLRWGAVLHDVGKIGVPDAILFKPGGLSAEEWIAMREHVRIGYRMLKGIPFLENSLPVILGHHERWDGGGYPAGLSGEEIPLGARIFKVADVFDALTTSRPYKAALPFEEACALIAAGAGTEFDPEVVAAFQRARETFHPTVPLSRGRFSVDRP